MSPYYTRLRDCVGHDRLLVPSVTGIILNEFGELLLQERADFRQWGLPAGTVEPGESFRQALRREVWEETGLMVIHAEPFAIYSDEKYSITYPNGDEIQPVHVAFYIQEWTGELTVNDDETLALRFFPIECLPAHETMHYPQITLIRDFARYRVEGKLIID